MKKIWNFCNGKKTAIALVFYFVTENVVPIIYPNGIPMQASMIIKAVADLLTVLGLGHKGIKYIKANTTKP